MSNYTDALTWIKAQHLDADSERRAIERLNLISLAVDSDIDALPKAEMQLDINRNVRLDWLTGQLLIIAEDMDSDCLFTVADDEGGESKWHDVDRKEPLPDVVVKAFRDLAVEHKRTSAPKPEPVSNAPIPFAETTSWSPCHVGRALAIRDAFLPNGGGTDAYGSDVGGHLDLLAARERKELERWMPKPTKLLSQSEVAALADGTIIDVRWSGGNGPHRYVVPVGNSGPHRYVVSVGNSGERWATQGGVDVGPLTLTGPRPLTEVSLPVDTEAPGEVKP